MYHTLLVLSLFTSLSLSIYLELTGGQEVSELQGSDSSPGLPAAGRQEAGGGSGAAGNWRGGRRHMKVWAGLETAGGTAPG